MLVVMLDPFGRLVIVNEKSLVIIDIGAITVGSPPEELFRYGLSKWFVEFLSLYISFELVDMKMTYPEK